MMAAGPNQSMASSEILAQSECKHLAPASVRSRGVKKQKGDDLVPDARFVHLLKDQSSHVSAVESELAGTPKKELGSSTPVEEDGDGSSVSPERGREEFSVPMQDQPLRYLLVSGSSTIFSAACFSPAIRARWDRALRNRHTPNVHSKNLSGKLRTLTLLAAPTTSSIPS
ncbi:hypothetical protein GWK47_028731 [Chionoecetes opilio]|uniref:Uncharacterized protein n=1 Tax=Chionoecetes opilio TaxID=41210 RepID=A0A8J5D5K5_CHIOP|nr:hypothetical protein GWK47_028731 [Chionoecetes opilio]